MLEMKSKDTGDLILIRHADGYVTAYAHFGENSTKKVMWWRAGRRLVRLVQADMLSLHSFISKPSREKGN